jgi:hypothetical protein
MRDFEIHAARAASQPDAPARQRIYLSQNQSASSTRAQRHEKAGAMLRAAPMLTLRKGTCSASFHSDTYLFYGQPGHPIWSRRVVVR